MFSIVPYQTRNSKVDKSLWVDETEDSDYVEPSPEPKLRLTRSLFPIWENELIKKHKAVVKRSFPLLHALHVTTKVNIEGIGNSNNINNNIKLSPVAEVLGSSLSLTGVCIPHSTIRLFIYFQVYFLLSLAIQNL